MKTNIFQLSPWMPCSVSRSEMPYITAESQLLQSRNCFCYIPVIETEVDILIWNTSRLVWFLVYNNLYIRWISHEVGSKWYIIHIHLCDMPIEEVEIHPPISFHVFNLVLNHSIGSTGHHHTAYYKFCARYRLHTDRLSTIVPS